MKLTVPQIILMNHGAWCNSKKLGLDKDGEDKPRRKVARDERDPVVNGKRMSEMKTEEIYRYFTKSD